MWSPWLRPFHLPRTQWWTNICIIQRSDSKGRHCRVNIASVFCIRVKSIHISKKYISAKESPRFICIGCLSSVWRSTRRRAASFPHLLETQLTRDNGTATSIRIDLFMCLTQIVNNERSGHDRVVQYYHAHDKVDLWMSYIKRALRMNEISHHVSAEVVTQKGGGSKMSM